MMIATASELIQSLPAAALVLDAEGRVRDANEIAAGLLGAPAADALRGLSLESIARADPNGRTECLNVTEQARELRLHAQRVDGVPILVDVSARRIDADGTILCLLRAVGGERLVTETQRYLDTAFESSPISMALFDTHGRYIRVNEALCRMLGRPADGLLGRRDQEVTHPDDRRSDVEAAWRILNGELDSWQTQKRFLRPDGAVVWVIANMAFLRDAGQRPLCWFGTFQDITTHEKVMTTLRVLAEVDELTGLANRRRLTRELSTRVQVNQEHGAVVLLDLDGFKDVNDRRGHRVGDELLIAIGRALQSVVGDAGLVGRLGGDEFAAILPGARAGRAGDIAAEIERLVEKVSEGEVTASCGTATFGPEAHRDPEALLDAADRAMYLAKQSRRVAGATSLVR